MITAVRFTTTVGSYTATIKDEDRAEFEANMTDPQAFVRELSETVSKTDKKDQNLTIHADGIGWVGLNTNYLVAVELLDDDA